MNGNDPIATITGTGGAFTAVPAGLNIDPFTGLIDLDQSKGNTTYTVMCATGGVCPASSIVNVQTDSVDDARFT
jgi:hypothetical protein